MIMPKMEVHTQGYTQRTSLQPIFSLEPQIRSVHNKTSEIAVW